MENIRAFIITALVLLITLILFESTSIDLWFQNFLYDEELHQWLYNEPGLLVRFIFYDGIKKLLILIALCLLCSLIFFRKKTIVICYKKGILIVLLSLIIVPSVTGLLKATTNVACPRDIEIYGGELSYVRVFEAYPVGEPIERQRCFPAGHASGGFALMSLYYLFHKKRNRYRGLIIGLTLGWTMGNYKMIIGDHFLSHTVVTMLLSWLLINLVVVVTWFFIRYSDTCGNTNKELK